MLYYTPNNSISNISVGIAKLKKTESNYIIDDPNLKKERNYKSRSDRVFQHLDELLFCKNKTEAKTKGDTEGNKEVELHHRTEKDYDNGNKFYWDFSAKAKEDKDGKKKGEVEATVGIEY